MRVQELFAQSFSLLFLLSTAACSGVPPTPTSSPMTVGGATVPPPGFIRFCLEHSDECDARPERSSAVNLTPDRRRELDLVQWAVNATVKPHAEPASMWDYPRDGYGDCNRYALEKRRDLEARGWPRHALLLAMAVTETGEGHLVLVAHTDRGDLVLDNRSAAVVDWASLPYRWVARQNTENLSQWVRITVGSG